MLTRQTALEVAKLFRFFDATCRNDLATHRIISERDYVSNLATHIRYPHGALCSARLRMFGRPLNSVQLSVSPRFLSVTSAPNIEQKYGCDGILIFSFNLGRFGTFHRVGMYEAKWPRLEPGTDAILKGWDDIGWRPISRKRTPPPPKVFKSRFTNELLRQMPLFRAGIVVWEQFFCQLNVPVQNEEFRKYGSTCVMHEDALTYLITNRKLWPSPEVMKPNPRSAYPGLRAWDEVDLSDLLAYSGLSFGYLIYLMLRPNQFGRYLQAVDNKLSIANPFGTIPPTLDALAGEPLRSQRPQADGNTPLLTIPVFTNEGATADDPLAISRFMRETGINSYIHLTFDKGFASEKELGSYVQAFNRNSF